MRGLRLATILLSALSGAIAALLLDSRSGARRRALMRDKLRHYARVVPRRLRRRARMVPGPLRGTFHTLTRWAPWREPAEPPDENEFVKHRVESALGRERDLPLSSISFDATDGVVRVRGTVPDEQTAQRIVRKAAAVDGVRAVISLLRTPDGRLVDAVEGDRSAIDRPRAALQAESVRRRLMERWPAIADADILASEGHIGRLAELICSRTGHPEQEVRAALDEILLSAVPS